MPLELSRDQAKLRALQLRLKEAGARGLTRELNTSLRVVGAEIVEAEKHAAERLPASGKADTGLRGLIAGAVKSRISRSKTSPGVSVFVPRGVIPGWKNPAKDLNSRGWRHPVFGNKRVWVVERSDTGWFMRTARAFRPEARRKIEEAVNRVGRKLTGH